MKVLLVCELLHEAGTIPERQAAFAWPWQWAPTAGCPLALQAAPALLVERAEWPQSGSRAFSYQCGLGGGSRHSLTGPKSLLWNRKMCSCWLNIWFILKCSWFLKIMLSKISHKFFPPINLNGFSIPWLGSQALCYRRSGVGHRICCLSGNHGSSKNLFWNQSVCSVEFEVLEGGDLPTAKFRILPPAQGPCSRHTPLFVSYSWAFGV